MATSRRHTAELTAGALLSARSASTVQLEEALFLDAASAPPPEPPAHAPLPTRPFGDFFVRQCLAAGVKLSKDGRSVFNYDPGKVTSGMNFLRLYICAPQFFTRGWCLQTLVIYCWVAFYAIVISDSPSGGGTDGKRGRVDAIASMCFSQISGLTRFVLGLYISLALARTYYANRSVFGTVFGSSMGFTQMVAAWVRSADDSAATRTSALRAQALLVRWVNAAYRLLVLEVRGLDAAAIGDVLVGKRLLTEREWAHVQGLPSRATHIYQWISNVVLELHRLGYLPHMTAVSDMNRELNVRWRSFGPPAARSKHPCTDNACPRPSASALRRPLSRLSPCRACAVQTSGGCPACPFLTR